jgi:predicted ester cyclase
MSTEENKAIVRRLIEEGMNQGKVSVFDELIAPNYVNYDFPTPTPGREGFKQVIFGLFMTAFPDMHVTVEDEIAESDKVATRGYFSGTHKGEFMGIPPTGKQIHVKYNDMWRVENGELVENWIQMDMPGLMQQLGVAPAPGQAS